MSFSSIAFLSVELKLTRITLNRSINHVEERTTDKGVQVGVFFIENSLTFFILI